MNVDFHHLNWDQVFLFFKSPALYLYFLITVAGVAVHFGKEVFIEKKANGSIIEYWATNKRASIIAVASAVSGFVYLYNVETMDIFAYFGMGYVANSFFNRAGIQFAQQADAPLPTTASAGVKPLWRRLFGW